MIIHCLRLKFRDAQVDPEASASTLGVALEVGKAYHDHSTRTELPQEN